MVKMVTTSYKSSNFSTKAYNFTFVIIPHSLVAFKLPILKSFFYKFYVNIHLCFNRTFQSFTLDSNLLAMVVKLLDCDINILDFVINLSISVLINVASPNDALDISLEIGPKLKEEWDEIFAVIYIKDYHLFNTFFVARPFVVLSYSKIWSIYNTSFFTPLSFVVQFLQSFLPPTLKRIFS